MYNNSNSMVCMKFSGSRHHKKISLVDKRDQSALHGTCFAVGLLKPGCYRESLRLEPSL